DTRRYRGLFLCTGMWDPVLPTYPGSLSIETMHSVDYRSPTQLTGRNVLVVGGGNSACDLACDAARTANEATISMRRAYHFIPKYLFGKPTDVFAEGVALPHWLERLVFEGMLRVLVGDLRAYGLPKPDHSVLSAHPLMNTQILHYLGHGDLEHKPDVERLDERTVHFVDGSSKEFDLVIYATGYRVAFPFMPRDHFTWAGSFPDLFLSAFDRKHDNVCCLGLHQSNGAVYDFSTLAADMMCNFIVDQRERPDRAAEFRTMIRESQPDLTGGLAFLPSDRHRTHIENAAFRRVSRRINAKLGWAAFGTAHPPHAAHSGTSM
ncbi:MAG: NAD(P)-binding domain-containing protein, partial [Polyangiales bacterium]